MTWWLIPWGGIPPPTSSIPGHLTADEASFRKTFIDSHQGTACTQARDWQLFEKHKTVRNRDGTAHVHILAQGSGPTWKFLQPCLPGKSIHSSEPLPLTLIPTPGHEEVGGELQEGCWFKMDDTWGWQVSFTRLQSGQTLASREWGGEGASDLLAE